MRAAARTNDCSSRVTSLGALQAAERSVAAGDCEARAEPTARVANADIVAAIMQLARFIFSFPVRLPVDAWCRESASSRHIRPYGPGKQVNRQSSPHRLRRP